MPTIANIEAGGHVLAAAFLGDMPVFALAEGTAVLAGGGERRIEIANGISCAQAALDGRSLVCAGEDGSIHAVGGDGSVRTFRAATGKWADALACGPAGAVAVASGRNATVLLADGGVREIACERSIEALAFAPKGLRLALARYNGVELHFVQAAAPPQFLEWKGAHTLVRFSPDGKYVVTAMQENALHGWRLTDGKHMRMTGYPAKIRSLSFSARGEWLASSGAPAAITWPFSGRDGPMGKPPLELGAMGEALATTVAFHPRDPALAIGYANGMILAVRVADGREIALRRGGAGAVSALAWDAAGRRLAFGSAEGEAGIVDLAT
jgi:WD40 repeat protein